MIELVISEPTIEDFFNHSEDEILKALRFIVDNNIQDYKTYQDSIELTNEQKEKLNLRIISFHKNRTIGKSWNEIKNSLN